MNDRDSRKGNFVVGAMLILLGAAISLHRAGIIQVSSQWTVWPFLLFGIGLALLVSSPAGAPKRGLLFLTGGLWLFLGEAGVVAIEDSWPILVIVLGLLIALNGGRRRPRWHRPQAPAVPGAPADPVQPGHLPRRPGSLAPMAVLGIWIAVFVAFQVSGIRTIGETTSSDRVRVVAVMGRAEHTSRATEFEGADVTNVMARSELDLRAALVAPGDIASVRVISLMGGVVVRVPQGWTVDTGAISALGAVVDERVRVPAADAAAGPPPRIVLRGLVMFGRLTIRS